MENHVRVQAQSIIQVHLVVGVRICTVAPEQLAPEFASSFRSADEEEAAVELQLPLGRPAMLGRVASIVLKGSIDADEEPGSQARARPALWWERAAEKRHVRVEEEEPGVGRRSRNVTQHGEHA